MDAGNSGDGAPPNPNPAPAPNPTPAPNVPAAPPNVPPAPPNVPVAPPPGGGSGDNGGGGPGGNRSSQAIIARLGMLYLQLNEVINNMSRTNSLIMKGVLIGSFIISALGLNKPSATFIRGIRHVLNGTLRLIGLQLGGSVESVVDVLIALGEQYGLYYVVQWAVDSALCLEAGNCKDKNNILLDYIQSKKDDICGKIQKNQSYCHLAFNCVPFMILLVGVIFLYSLALCFGGENGHHGPRPGPTPTPTPAPQPHPNPPKPPVATKPINPSPTQSITASCPTCKKESTLAYPKPSPSLCPNCESKPGPSKKPTIGPTSAPSQNLHGCRLYTNFRILDAFSSSDRLINVLTNISNRDALASAIYNSISSDLPGLGGSGDNGDDDDDPNGCCDLSPEELAFLKATIQKYTQELCEQVAGITCLNCHDNLHAEGLCSCPNCGLSHGPNNSAEA